MQEPIIIVGAGLLASWSLRVGTGAFLSETSPDATGEAPASGRAADDPEAATEADSVAEAIARETEDVEA